eukprot:sb/3478552/
MGIIGNAHTQYPIKSNPPPRYHIGRYSYDLPRRLQRAEIARAMQIWKKVAPIEFLEVKQKARYSRTPIYRAPIYRNPDLPGGCISPEDPGKSGSDCSYFY